jgi:hypothetical protein
MVKKSFEGVPSISVIVSPLPLNTVLGKLITKNKSTKIITKMK